MQKKDQTTQELFSIITEVSTIQGIKETLKLCMDSLKSNTLNTLLTQDTDYQAAMLEYRQAHQLYQDTDFTESQREIIDTLLARKDESEFEHIANAYMAGLLDSYRILKNFDLTLEWPTDPIKQHNSSLSPQLPKGHPKPAMLSS